MRCTFRWRLFGCCLLLGLAGCARSWFEEREPWRHEAEISCLKSGTVKESPSVAVTKAIDGPGACGVDFPLRVAALGETALVSFAEESSAARQVAVAPAATLACPLVSALDRFVSDSVQPAARRWFSQPVVGIKQISAYSCRGMNDVPDARISEHAFGNALDIAAFTLADGRTITVPLAWSPRLAHRTVAERANWRLIGQGSGIHWPELDEDISVESLLAGRRSGENAESLRRWMEARRRSGD